MSKVSEVVLYLFGEPSWELMLEQGTRVTLEVCDRIEELGHELQRRLLTVARIARSLIRRGWSGVYEGHYLVFRKPIPKQEAELELLGLGIGRIDIREVNLQ